MKILRTQIGEKSNRGPIAITTTFEHEVKEILMYQAILRKDTYPNYFEYFI